jgi:hypothetical protein
MEIAKMFGQMPAALLALPSSEYRRLQHYYFAVKDKESEALAERDAPDDLE